MSKTAHVEVTEDSCLMTFYRRTDRPISDSWRKVVPVDATLVDEYEKLQNRIHEIELQFDQAVEAVDQIMPRIR